MSHPIADFTHVLMPEAPVLSLSLRHHGLRRLFLPLPDTESNRL